MNRSNQEKVKPAQSLGGFAFREHVFGQAPTSARSASPACRLAGVMVHTNLALGRQILTGVRQFCTEQNSLRLSLLSDVGFRESFANADGLDNFSFLIGQVEGKQAEAMARCGKPFVQISNRHPSAKLPQVISNDFAVGQMGAEYLLGLGYRKLVFLTMPNLAFGAEREKGFVDTAVKEKAELHLMKHWSQLSMPEVARCVLSLGKNVAVMAPSDLHARWLIEAFDDPEATVPHRVAVLGVDDDLLENNLSPVPLSSIRLAGERIGYEAATMGFRLASGKAEKNWHRRVAPVRVIIRQSTNKLAIPDDGVARALRYIRDNIGELQSVTQLCNALKIQRRSLEIRFNRILSSSIAHEMTVARIQRASELLAESNLSIKEIAYLVGYTEPRRLSIAFKRETGERPIDYRNRVMPMR